MLMGEDIGVFNGAFKVTAGLLEEFGEKRVRDTPISENTIVGMGVGAAMTGLRPVVELMTINFSLLAMDQIVNHAASIRYMFGGQVKVPLVVRMPQGAGHQLGPTHSHSWEALYLHVPGLLVAVPTTAADAKGLLKSAIRDDNPVIFIEHEYLYGQRGEVPDDEDFTVDFGQAAIRREGSDVTIVGISRMALTAARAAKTLSEKHGIEAEVIDPRTLRPLDLDTILASVRKTQPLRDRRGGLAARRRRREPRRVDLRAGLRRPRRADPARHRRRRADAVLQAAGAARVPARAAGHRSRAGHDSPDAIGHAMSEIVMPRLSDSMEEGTILKWLKADGDAVARGEPLAEIETDKATLTYESDAAGMLTIVVAAGETLPIGEVIARLDDGAGGGAPAAERLRRRARRGARRRPRPRGRARRPAHRRDEPAAPARRPRKPPPPRRAARGGPGQGLPARAPHGPRAGHRPAPRRRHRPGRTRRQGRRRGRGEGRHREGLRAREPAPARRRARRAEAVARRGPRRRGARRRPSRSRRRRRPARPRATSRSSELTRIQQVIARRMAESKATVPEFTLRSEIDMEGCVAAARTAQGLGGEVPSYNDMVVKACALALREFPRANGSYKDGKFELHSRVNVGVAVAAHGRARRADDLRRRPQVAARDRPRIARRSPRSVRAGTVTPPELSGGTFTVSNLGMFGVTDFTAVINPPQAAILAVGALAPRAVVRDGALVARNTMGVTLACDHRILYGADAAQFLARIRALLEQPLALAF